MTTKQAIQDLKSSDIYSLLLFSLFRVREIPEYSAISELAFVLDEKNLLSLCEYFGGVNITIPTITEIENILLSLLIFQMVNIEGNSYDEAVEMLGDKIKDRHEIRLQYNKMCKVLNDYDFTSRFN